MWAKNILWLVAWIWRGSKLGEGSWCFLPPNFFFLIVSAQLSKLTYSLRSARLLDISLPDRLVCSLVLLQAGSCWQLPAFNEANSAVLLIVWEFLGVSWLESRAISVRSSCCQPPWERKPVPGLLHIKPQHPRSTADVTLDKNCLSIFR